ncbi:MAG: PIN domain-containing protein [Thermoleophilia bacterium]
MAVLVDTDQLIEIERGSARGRDLDAVIGDEERAISVISVSELLHGVLRASEADRMRLLSFAENLLGAMRPVPIDEQTARVHAAVGAQLAADGLSIGTHDLWIAATALSRDLGVATHNVRDFGRIPGLRVVSP